MEKILLFPFNGNAKEAVSVIDDLNKQAKQWQIVGFIDDDRQKCNQRWGEYKIIGGREKIRENPNALILAVPGRPENFQERGRIIKSLNLQGGEFATIIHPSAAIGARCKVGHNSLIMQNVVLTANVTIGNNVVILPNSVVSHDSVVEDDTVIGSNVSISGNVRIAKNCYLGTGAKVIQDIRVGEKALIGIGSVVLKDVPSRSVVAGNPAERIGSINE